MQQDWRKRHLGLFALLAVLVIAGTLTLDFLLSRSIARDRAANAAVTYELGSLQVALAELRAAEAAYVATGQSPDVSLRRADELTSRLDTGLTRLRDTSTNDNVRASYQAALDTFTALTALDKKARAYISSSQEFLAADVVFIESQDGSRRLADQLEQLRAVQAAQTEASAAQMNWLRFGATTLAMGLVLAVALRVGKPAPLSPATEAALTAQMIRELPPVVKPSTPLAARTASSAGQPAAATPPAAPAAPPTPAPAPAPPPPPSVNLPDAAELCVDLARVMDGRDVPALLERAARVLSAKGVILWMADADGRVLRPSLSHGYSEKVLGRLGTLDVDSDNVTSLAFRSARPQTMPGSGPNAAGAVAVPLVTASGCSGVLAAELRDSKPAPELLALTRIVAAQFATLIAPVELGAAARAAEA
jgi:hypothetical protein